MRVQNCSRTITKRNHQSYEVISTVKGTIQPEFTIAEIHMTDFKRNKDYKIIK